MKPHPKSLPKREGLSPTMQFKFFKSDFLRKPFFLLPSFLGQQPLLRGWGRGFSSIFLTIGITSILLSCKPSEEDEGEKLAQVYCVGCHQFPEPSLLPKNVWQYGTLPYMSIYLGVKRDMAKLKPPIADDVVLQPTNQMIDDRDWEKIKKYYLKNAPEKLDLPKPAQLEELTGLFDINTVSAKIPNGTIANFTAIGIDANNQRIIASDQTNKTIWVIDSKGKPMQSIQNQNAVTNIDFSEAKKQQYLLTYVGSTTQPNPEVGGYAERVSLTNDSYKIIQKLLPKLNRSTQVSEVNLDKDTDNELVSCEYGYIKGKLCVWNKDKKGVFQEQILSETVGAIKTIILDFDGDKKLDIVAQFAQGDERIVLYKNQGNNQFQEKALLQFPPSYGSSSFELADMNKDGQLDIVYTAGDNADFSSILKPYHGVYVFTNKGNLRFEQTYFFYQNGSYRALPRDFDADGDLDLAVISMFPDVDKNPREGFVYLENTGSDFKAKTLNINHLGRWNVIDANDLDNDGDIDIVLGSHPVAPFPAGFDQAWKQGSGLLILTNKTK